MRSFLYGLGLLLYVLLTSAFVQPVDFSESSSISETSEKSKSKKRKKKKHRLRR